MPTPTLGEYKGLEIPKRPVVITDEQVDARLGLLRERLATLQPVEDRPVQNGDFVLMDLEGSRDGKLIEGAQGKGQMFEVGNAQLIPGFEEEIIGVARDEEKTFDLTFPDDYQAEDLAGQDATFKVTVKEIKTKVVPELNDAFAADVSEFETLADLRADLRSRLEAAATQGVEQEFRTAVVDKAVANASVGVPRAMIADEAHRLFHDLESDISERGISMETYLGVLEKTRQEAEDGMRPQAERVLRRRLVIDTVAVAEGLSVSDDEIATAVKRDVEATGGDYLKLLADLHKSGRQEQLRAELLVVKTVDFLTEQAVQIEWTEADELAAEAVEAEEAAVEVVEEVVEEAAEADAPPVP
jgi:trigger factor